MYVFYIQTSLNLILTTSLIFILFYYQISPIGFVKCETRIVGLILNLFLNLVLIIDNVKNRNSR